MNRSTLLRNVVIGVVVVAILGGAIFLYATREIAAPTRNVEEVVEQLDAPTDTAGSETLFRVSQEESTAEYNIDEVLNGSAIVVVGTTNEVAGDILINTSDLSQSQIGEISINARTFETAESRRDNSVARFILQSENAANEFITFEPTSLTALPTIAEIGDTVEFQVTGDLTVAGGTFPVTFDVAATLESDARLVGSAETTVNHADLGLTINAPPFVASIGETVTLKFNFVANAVTEAA